MHAQDAEETTNKHVHFSENMLSCFFEEISYGNKHKREMLRTINIYCQFKINVIIYHQEMSLAQLLAREIVMHPTA
jgi:hypothetical protein